MAFACFLVAVALPLLASGTTQTCDNPSVVAGGPDCIYIINAPRLPGGTCPSLVDAAQHVIDKYEAEQLIAYYPLDTDANDSSSHGRNGVEVGSGVYGTSDAICGGSRFFDGNTKIEVDAFRNFEWGDKFSVSVWLKRTGQFNNYQGVVNNGYGNHGTWEMRMGRENGGTMIGGGIITADSSSVWDYVYLTAATNQWHHVVMTYGCGSLQYYLDAVAQEGDEDCCTGPILRKDTPLTIGQAGPGTDVEYFYGYIDEIKLFAKTLSAEEVQKLYQNPCQ